MTWLMISFRLVLTFGRDTIQKFSTNVSDLSKLAARDFEDILQASFYLKNILVQSLKSDQCAIPVFNGLLPELHNAIVLNLLFKLATWCYGTRSWPYLFHFTFTTVNYRFSFHIYRSCYFPCWHFPIHCMVVRLPFTSYRGRLSPKLMTRRLVSP